MRVLLIEDDETCVCLLRELLTRRSVGPSAFEVRRAASLFEAIQLLEGTDETLDAVLLDLGLPECGGLTTLRLARASSPHLPIVVITSRDGPGAVDEAVLAGADDYLVKGRITPERLEFALIAAASRHEGRLGAVGPPPELRGTFRLATPP